VIIQDTETGIGWEPHDETTDWRAVCVMLRTWLCGEVTMDTPFLEEDTEFSPHNYMSPPFYKDPRKDISSLSTCHFGAYLVTELRDVTAHASNASAFISKSTSA